MLVQVGAATTTVLRAFTVCGEGQLHDLHSKLHLEHPEGQANQLHKCAHQLLLVHALPAMIAVSV